MSVINKMLRDLDQRNASQGPNGEPVFATSTRNSANAQATTSTGVAWGRVAMALAALVLVAGAAVGGWISYHAAATREPATSEIAPVVTTPAIVAASAPQLLASSATTGNATEAATASAPVPAASEGHPLEQAVQMPVPVATAPAIQKSIELKLATRLLESPPASTPTKPEPKAVTAADTAPATKLAPLPVHPPAAHTTAVQPHTPAPPVTDAQLLQRQQHAGKEALAQAQVLWSSGNREAAISLLVDAVAVSDRAAQAGNPTTLLVQQVRELARMELAEGRAQAVLDLLVRLEPVLGGQPDLWAVRANAAQRLGRHQDSVNAYKAALQARPTEQRWLLGSAVSLAALGQLAEAAEMTERARKVGAVSAEVLAYLRQQGVQTGDR